MGNRKKYQDLAETIFFTGLNRERLQQLGFQLKKGKIFRDIGEAVDTGRTEGIGEFNREIGCIARKLEEVLDVLES